MTRTQDDRDTPTIALLPELVQNQIAAGEVVERPASIVKELVENALDAGAERIRVDLEEGGAKLVRVVDDGCGMSPSDLLLAFEPHATSKLRSVDDLEHIASLGFRGEALASIGSVARVRILSRLPERGTAWEIVNEGGHLRAPVEAGGPRGTTLEVRDLFYNTPARRRFLKRTSTELSRCLDVLQRLALAHTGVGFTVTHDGKRSFDVEPQMDLRDRVRRAFGAELADSLVGVEGSDGTTRVTGLLAPPRFARRDTARQMWFLNGRPLRDKLLVRCLRDALKEWIFEARHPVGFLHISMDPAAVDVNVHPMKSEVRFREERRLFGFLVGVLRDAIRRTDVATPGAQLLSIAERREGRSVQGFELPDPGVLAPRPRADGEEPDAAPRVRDVDGRPWTPAPPAGASARAARTAEGAWRAVDDLRGPYLQIDRTYIVRPLPDGFEVIDQHALHERLTLEGLKRDLREGRIEVQRLLVPELVDVGRSELGLLEGHLEELATMGIELAPMGETSVAVHGLPARLRNPDVEGVVRDVVAVLEETGRAPDPAHVLEEVLHRCACRSSIMAGDELDEASIHALLRRAAEQENDQTCAHGRPTRVRFTLADLEKAFHRA